MRGSSFPDTSEYVTDAILMGRYNQPYSELENMPMIEKIFLLRLAEAEDQYIKQQAERSKINRGKKIL